MHNGIGLGGRQRAVDHAEGFMTNPPWTVHGALPRRLEPRSGGLPDKSAKGVP
ncbi:MAG: hypothetical protein JRM80_01200 [Nitrososphaerota archaeon]|jgi:hypothetical protein|nr:hypothetical protein [Nitrososphaerota archaeon]MDG6938168.1 hypothetical protein [Nitrososphaerota archaeon]MDG6960219.1 hypothetical protein [Nitrososphaerota archaeon]MDG6974200.1 hypothetical protein [Nitrososphaerota archaeon]MDG6987248.1 hypothetical protein [Nitrososphaerota archaeon]